MALSHRSRRLLLLLLLVLLHVGAPCGAGAAPKVPDAVQGLAYEYYSHSCPTAEKIVHSAVKSFLAPNISQAGALIRLAFHDCFVNGCDGSVLLNGTNSEEEDPPNLTLRPEALDLVQEIKQQLEVACPGTVSCSDILSLAGRDATAEAGGPHFKIPTGRLDSLGFADLATVLASLPPPSSNITGLLDLMDTLGLDKTDLVALSGAHTVGLAHCGSFNSSLRPTISDELDPEYAQTLLEVCPDTQSNEEAEQDMVTPNVFDNQYFKNMLGGQVLFNSDRALLDDEDTKATVEAFAKSNKKFLDQFAYSFVKMSMLNVKTRGNGGQGTIRTVCYSSRTPRTASTETLPGVNVMYTAEDTLLEST